ncbi:P-loop containing nucleoside triphosphate hydrolase protein [Colletotrichum zoysiae]|uniref:ATP-dependent RNA helicase n=1 Tax=Colletotrichum zoysiae TaxID=1216348 RepID=A0AAD9LTG0_9PEZI|nr:P-loop containing nucleoside triphosphate hydrolase protein [Colletotrichum zoysiae]
MYARYVPSKKTKEAPKPAEPSPPPPPAPEPSSAPADDGLVSGGSTASPYARFVPSKSSKPRASLSNVVTADADGLSPATKRKHQVSTDAEEEEAQVKKKKKKSGEHEDGTAPDGDDATPKKSKKEKKDKKSKSKRLDEEPTGDEPADGDAMNTRDEADRETESQETGEKKKSKKKKKKSAPEASESEIADQEDGAEVPRPKKDKSKKKKDRGDAGDGDGDGVGVDARHKAVLAKATKYLKKAAELAPADAPEKMDVDEAAEEVEEHGLEPLPQPEPAPLDDSKPSYETLPHWLAAPIRVAPDTRTPFADIGINPKAARALESKGFRDAFAVQTAAVPLLLPSCKHRQGDLLVAAATGSGKTLAYALPVVRDVSQGAVTRLRALVVLPTRELVKQAQEVFELCAGAFDGRDQKRARIGISIGSQQLRHEQAALVERVERYDPEAYRAARRRELDAWKDVEEQPATTTTTTTAGSEDAPAAGSLPDHVVDYASKVDVLICTPGRLVEHINLTPGFSLDYVRWLVVDEADKLLAQSFQGWLDVVMPKLRANNRFSARDFPDSNLGGVVRKIVLSATLTRDLGLLSGLQLRRPQLIVLEGGSQADGGAAPVAEHTLPTLLKESAIRVHDANLKPLYLIDLLLGGHLMSETATKALSAPAAAGDDGDDETSSSDASSDTSSDAGSDADSDTSSDSDSDSSSSSSSSSSDSSSDDAAAPKTKTARTLFTTTALIFTKSNESALRLSRLIALLQPSLAPSIATLTSTQKTSDRRRALRAFAGRRLRLLVASDLVARGVDLPLLDNVVNYDLPASAAGYVHRVGRTARAGRAGAAWTFVEDAESGWFWGKIAKPSSGIRRAARVERLRIGDPDAGGFGDERVRQYEDALETLGKEAGEARRHR